MNGMFGVNETGFRLMLSFLQNEKKRSYVTASRAREKGDE